MNSSRLSNPPPGTLIEVKASHGGGDRVTLGFMDDREEEVEIPIGTHAIVIGEWVRPWDKGDPMPLISCDHGVGWLFRDEILVINEKIPAG